MEDHSDIPYIDPHIPLVRYAQLEDGKAVNFINVREGDEETARVFNAVPAPDNRVQHGCPYDEATGQFVIPEEQPQEQ